MYKRESNIKKDIKEFILDEFSPEESQLKDNILLFDAGIIDSLGMVKLTAFIKESYGVNINPSEVTMENFNTIEKIAKFISEKTKNNV